jgi:hypothetical protein
VLDEMELALDGFCHNCAQNEKNKEKNMKRAVLVIFFAVFALCNVFSQNESEGDPITFLFGPRLGVTFVITNQSDFDDQVQSIYSSDHSYFPVFSEIGFCTLQQIDLGSSRNFLVFQETFLLGGLDQNFALPFVTILMGYKSGFGFEAGIGPYFSLFHNDKSDNIQMLVSLTYMVGWSFSGKDFSIPLSIHYIPYPSYINPQFTITCGINFAMKD